jgi:mono/diheme cytochrome c family protein
MLWVRHACAALILAIAALATPPARAADSADAALVQRGAYIATAADCTACHTAPGAKPFAGGASLQTPFGAIMATNITPSKTYGIGNYTFAQFTAALRKGVRADGAHLYPAMPYTAYSLMPDDDVRAVYAYFMHGVAPVESASPTTKLPFPFNIRLSMAAWNFLFLGDKRFTPDAGKSAEWNRGAYLVRGLAHCDVCHSARDLLMGEKASRALGGTSTGTWFAPNVTSDINSGIGGWSEQELVDYLRSGRVANKAQAAGPMAEAIDASLRHLTDGDLRAIAVYLKAVPPLHDGGDTRPPFAWGAPADDLTPIRGVPWPADRNRMSGPQLYDGYCASCHGSEAQGAGNGALPSLFHNTAMGRTNTDNLVMVVLEGVHRQPDATGIRMPGFADALSDQQIATLAGHLTGRYGNPQAKVTVAQVHELRSGGSPSPLIGVARAVIIAVASLVVLIVAYLAFRAWRRRMA